MILPQMISNPNEHHGPQSWGPMCIDGSVQPCTSTLLSTALKLRFSNVPTIRWWKLRYHNTELEYGGCGIGHPGLPQGSTHWPPVAFCTLLPAQFLSFWLSLE